MGVRLWGACVGVGQLDCLWGACREWTPRGVCLRLWILGRLSPPSGRLGGPRGLAAVLAAQGEFRVVERQVTMRELRRALQESRVREVFGSGTACQVCPVHQILYEGQVRVWAPGLLQGWGRRPSLGLMAPSPPAPPHPHHGEWAGARPPLPEGLEGDPGEL